MRNMQALVVLVTSVILADCDEGRVDSELVKRNKALLSEIQNLREVNKQLSVQLAALKAVKKKAPSGSASDQAPPGKWRRSITTSRIDDSQNITLSLDAEEKIVGWPSKSYLPSLILRCAEKKASAYFVVGMSPNIEYGHDGATVLLRFDKKKAYKTRMAKSTDGNALFVWRPKRFIRRCLKHDSLLFQFTPYSSSPATTRFKLHGLKKAIQLLAKRCPIKKRRKKKGEMDDYLKEPCNNIDCK